MAHPRHRADQLTQFSQKLPSQRLLPMVLLPILAVGVVTVARVSLAPARLAAGLATDVATADAKDVTNAAADALEATLLPGGPGYRFEIVQTSTMLAKPDGPKIPIPADSGRGTKELDGWVPAGRRT